MSISEKLLEIKKLSIQYETVDGIVKAVNNVDLHIAEGTTLGLVGETGAGKTTLAKSILRLIQCPPGHYTEGEIIFDGKDLIKIPLKELREIRGEHISMIFQDPMTSLNPVLTVGKQIAEAISEHNKNSKIDAMGEAMKMLETVGIPGNRAREYPHQFSGGMKQRVVIAIALACNPRLLIADEPTTALDVTIQAQILEMIKDLCEKLNMTMLLITHDLGVVAQNCDYVAIMYAGEIVEYGDIKSVFKNPAHPYTLGLFGALPKLNEDVDRLQPIDGQMPDPTCLPSGCSFAARCKYAQGLCLNEKATMHNVDGAHHVVRCILYANTNRKEVIADGEL